MTGPAPGSALAAQASPGTGSALAAQASPGTGSALAAQASPGTGSALAAQASPGGERQVPFYCPYCGEESLRPAGADAGSWDCRSCARSFQLRFAGVLAGGEPAGGAG